MLKTWPKVCQFYGLHLRTICDKYDRLFVCISLAPWLFNGKRNGDCLMYISERLTMYICVDLRMCAWKVIEGKWMTLSGGFLMRKWKYYYNVGKIYQFII